MDIQQKISLSLDKATILLQEQVNLFKAQLSGGEKDVMKYINKISDLTAQLATAEESDKERINKEIAKEQSGLNSSSLILAAKQAGQKAIETNATTPETNANNSSMGISGVANASTAQNVSSTNVSITVNNNTESIVEVKQNSISASPGTIVPIEEVRGRRPK